MNTSNEISNTHTVFPFVLFFSLGYCLKYAALLCMGNNYVSDVNVESLVVYRGFQLHHGGKSLTVKCCCYFNFPFFCQGFTVLRYGIETGGSTQSYQL